MMTRCMSCFEEFDERFVVCPHCGYYPGAKEEPAYRLPHGTVLQDRYVLGKSIGVGGFGITYKAWDKSLERVIAVKEYYLASLVTRIPGTKDIILTSKKNEAVFRSGYIRLLDEARSVAKFNGENNIVKVLGYFEENNTAYMTMEYLEGMDLKDYMRQKGGKLNVEESIRIIVAASIALEAVHKRKIVHRDIAPDNIRIDGDRITLIDFGAARFSDCAEPLDIVLKPGFAPPEQYDTVNDQGPWTDVYALGATMYMLLTGIHPEESTNRKEEEKDELIPPHEIDEAIPENLSNAIMKAMAVDRHMRFNDMAEFRKAIQGEKKVLTIKKERKRRKRRRFLGIAAAMLILLMGFGVFAMNYRRQKAAETLPDAKIVVWVCEHEGESKYEALQSIKTEFETGYENVEVEIVSIPEEEYEDKLILAFREGNAPEIFESDGLKGDCSEWIQDVADIIKPFSEEIYFYSYVYQNAVENKKLATGFCMPILYVNTREYTGSMKYADIQKQETRKLTEFRDLESFLQYQDNYYYGDTSQYKEISASMGGLYKIVAIDGKLSCSYGAQWSLAKCGRDKTKVGKKFLEFLYSGNSQDHLYIRYDNHQLPVNKNALEVYVSTYPEFRNMFDGLEEYDIR